MASFCSTCGNALVDDARFCSKCGTPVAATEPVGEQREFVIPLPDDSPFRTLVLTEGDHILTKQQLWTLGVNRPERADHLLHRGMTHLWRHFEGHARARLAELEAEGWELAEPFEPRSDFYGILTTAGIKDRIRFEETHVPGTWGNKQAITIHGLVFKMHRVGNGMEGTST